MKIELRAENGRTLHSEYREIDPTTTTPQLLLILVAWGRRAAGGVHAWESLSMIDDRTGRTLCRITISWGG